MIKIALFGATGGTGRTFLEQALREAYTVKALVRTPSKLDLEHPNLLVIPGDVLDYKSVLSTLRDCDIVVSLFGQVKDSPRDLQTRGTENILKAMQASGIERIISLSGGGLPFPAKDQPKLADRLIRGIMKLAVPHILEDAQQHAALLKASDRSWMVVRAPRLINAPAKGNYRVGWVGVNASTKIARPDLAHFILKQVADFEYPQQMPFVSY